MSTDVGRQAEEKAAQYLQQNCFKIIQQNWRTRWCEIDIIAQKDTAVYFIEVKYRSTTLQGTGFDYITTKKLQQMQFAASFWLSQYGRDDYDYRLGAIEVKGSDFTISEWLDDL